MAPVIHGCVMMVRCWARLCGFLQASSRMESAKQIAAMRLGEEKALLGEQAFPFQTPSELSAYPWIAVTTQG